MAKRKKKTTARKATPRKGAARRGKRASSARGRKGAVDLIISKSRTKATAGINVSGEFYQALDDAVRQLITNAERRAVDNGRKTLRPYDL